MKDKAAAPKLIGQFIPLPRDLLRSDAWRSQSINCRRLIDFLMIEEMAAWTRAKANGAPMVTVNGKLKAPYGRLEQFGIGARYVADAVREAELLGLIYVNRQGLKVATLYAITWLATHDGKAATNEWAAHRNPDLAPLLGPKPRVSNDLDAKNQKSASQREGRATLQREGRLSELPSEGKADAPV